MRSEIVFLMLSVNDLLLQTSIEISAPMSQFLIDGISLVCFVEAEVFTRLSQAHTLRTQYASRPSVLSAHDVKSRFRVSTSNTTT
uniref:Secreted protein n=1 Tax=Mesocestoides corti TaxID=53468 RepID=A0A5K3FAP2_MESCO